MSKLDELMAKIKVEVAIRKRQDGSIAVIGPAQRRAQEKRNAKTSADPALAALMRASNMGYGTVKAAPKDPYERFKAIGHTPLLQRQVCRCCGVANITVAAELLHLRGRINLESPILDVWVRRSTHELGLPFEEPLWAPSMSIAYCAVCLCADPNKLEFCDVFEPDVRPRVTFEGQLQLFQ